VKYIKNVKELLGVGVIAIFMTTTANATLELRLGGKAVYDVERNITWLADSSAASPNAFDNGISNNDGRVTYANTVDWLTNLNVAGVTGWDATDETSRWFNGFSSEVDFLIDELVQAPSFLDAFGGNQLYWSVGSPLVCSGFPCPGPFPTGPLGIGFSLGAPNGLRQSQFDAYQTAFLWPPEAELRILAMQGGDVFAQIPEPTVFLLLGIGLTGMIAVNRRRLGAR